MYAKIRGLLGNKSGRPDEALQLLLSGCSAGEEKSREMLYKHFYGYLMAVTLRYMKDRSVAEELVNDSFVKIFKNIHLFTLPQDPEAGLISFKGWMARITSRTAIDHLKVHKNTFMYTEMDEGIFLIPTGNVLEKLDAESILKLLDGLPDVHRVIFNMFEIEGYAHEEIAAYLDIPVKNSRVYLGRARNRLQHLYLQTLKR